MVGHKRERVLGRVGRAIDAAARSFAREAAQLFVFLSCLFVASSQSLAKEDPERGRTLGLSPKGA